MLDVDAIDRLEYPRIKPLGAAGSSETQPRRHSEPSICTAVHAGRSGGVVFQIMRSGVAPWRAWHRPQIVPVDSHPARIDFPNMRRRQACWLTACRRDGLANPVDQPRPRVTSPSGPAACHRCLAGRRGSARMRSLTTDLNQLPNIAGVVRSVREASCHMVAHRAARDGHLGSDPEDRLRVADGGPGIRASGRGRRLPCCFQVRRSSGLASTLGGMPRHLSHLPGHTTRLAPISSGSSSAAGATVRGLVGC